MIVRSSESGTFELDMAGGEPLRLRADDVGLRILAGIIGPMIDRVSNEMIVRLLAERDEARAEVDEYRRLALLRLGEFVGPVATVERIRDRLQGRPAPTPREDDETEP